MLQMIDVDSGYGKSAVLKSASLNISEGEFFIVVGLNGSGKSTLLKTLLGLLRPMKGKVLIENENLDSISFYKRAMLITLLDSHAKATFSMSVQELLEVGRAENKTDIREALGIVNLEGYENRNMLELSSGETKRAFLAHTLVSHSKIILLDEPFSHLDWSHQSSLLKNLKSWNKKYGTTFVMAVHELERAIQMATRVCVMKNGSILKIDSPDRIFDSKEVSETFAFKASIDQNPLDGSKRLTLGRANETKN